MYSESDIDAAVSANILTAETAARFRAFTAQQRQTPAVDEEYVRLVTGFNDIFVSIAISLMALATVWLLHGTPFLAGLALAAGTWGLAEYFTRLRRMALPSILLLLIYTGGVFTALLTTLRPLLGGSFNLFDGREGADTPVLIALALTAALQAGAIYLHWRRFHVPITIAAGAGAVALLGETLLLAAFPALRGHWAWLMLAAGFGVFALALRWDMSDRARITRRADVAFWLHLMAAPMIVHPLFSVLGLLGTRHASTQDASLALLIYAALAVTALLVDRRALLVSALGYVLWALSSLIHVQSDAGQNFAATALVAGSALLLLSALWHKARQAVLAITPGGLRAMLPAA